MIKNCNIHWEETEWGFPKGRRNGCEPDIDEAGNLRKKPVLNIMNIGLINKFIPTEEYIGSNNVK